MPTKTRTTRPASGSAQLQGFIRKFSPGHQRLIRGVRAHLRRLFPSAHELVYDNYNFLVIGYGPTERPSDAFLSIAAAANGVSICFLQGARLPDPRGILRGGGKQVRSLRLGSSADLRPPAVAALLLAASRSTRPLPRSGRGTLIIRSVSAKQRPRRKPPR